MIWQSEPSLDLAFPYLVGAECEISCFIASLALRESQMIVLNVHIRFYVRSLLLTEKLSCSSKMFPGTAGILT